MCSYIMRDSIGARIVGCVCRPKSALTGNRACVEILRQCGCIPNSEIALVDLFRIPEGLDAVELERYLREHGADLCGPRAA
jgi:hypothetical protein